MNRAIIFILNCFVALVIVTASREAVAFDRPVRFNRDVRTILAEADATAIFVTHDQEEALAIADIVAVMRDGRVHQIGTPHQIYRKPATPWIAQFVGESEFFDGVAGVGQVTTELGTFPQFGELRGDVRVMIRPEWVHPTPSTEGVALVVDHEYYGHDQLLVLELPGGRRITSRIGSSRLLATGDRVDIGIDEVVLFPRGS